MSLDRICRLCLRESSVFFSIFVDNRALMLENLTSIKICETDPVDQICLTCLCNLKLAFNIQRGMREADLKLKTMLSNIQNNAETRTDNGPANGVSQNEVMVDATDTVHCLICGRFVGLGTKSNEHIEKHFQDSRKCQKCGDRSFRDFSEYKQHIAVHHKNSSYFKCSRCDRTFFYETLYNVHIRNAHPQPQQHRKTSRNMFAKIQHLKPREFLERPCDPQANIENAQPQDKGLTKNTTVSCVKSETKKIGKKLDKNVKKDRTIARRSRKIDREAKKLKQIKRLISEKVVRTRIVEAKNRTYTCPVCQKVFNKYLKYWKHKEDHKKKKCPVCPKSVVTSYFNKHLRTHNLAPDLGPQAPRARPNSPATGEQQVCETCGGMFKNKTRLRAHQLYSHSDVPLLRFKCDRCGKGFKWKCMLDLHIRRDHDENPTFVCDTCGKKFYTNRQLTLHINRTHLKLRPHKCDFCEKAFTSRGAFKTHRRQHTFETPYRCEICGDGFKQNVSLKTHKKSKHNIVEEITVSCKKCGKGFSTAWGLKSHVNAVCS